MLNIEYAIFEAILIVFGVLALMPVFMNWRESKNRMYIAIFAYTIGVVIYSIINLLTYLLEIDTNVYLIGGLRFGYILGYILFTIQFEFMLYLRAYPKSQSLCFVVF